MARPTTRPKPLESRQASTRVRIVVSNHEMDPDEGTEHDVLGHEHDVVIIDWRSRRWPMLSAHVEGVSS